MTVSIGTIQALIDHDYSLTAWCRGCQHSHILVVGQFENPSVLTPLSQLAANSYMLSGSRGG